MKDFEYNKNGELSKSCSPSYWVRVEYMFITRIEMTADGGMGGSRWYEYVERLSDIPSNSIIKVRRYDGKEVYINTKYMTMAEDFKLAKATLDISEWESYYPKRENKKGIITHYTLIDDDMELKLTEYK